MTGFTLDTPGSGITSSAVQLCSKTNSGHFSGTNFTETTFYTTRYLK